MTDPAVTARAVAQSTGGRREVSDYPIPDSALAQHLAVLGKTGSGKTTTEKTMVEHLVAKGERVCVLDPVKSDWWGMTSSADGKRPGLSFQILGGPRGHVPLHETSGAAIGELVAKGDLPLSILDMRQFGPGGLSRFFTEFASILMERNRGVVHLVLEEAHMFAPKERAGFGAENLSIHWAKMLATAGRSAGIRLILATQRTQALHNALLGSCETMVVHRLTAPADQKPVLDWLKANAQKEVLAEVAADLSSLPTGTAWVCSGEARLFAKIAFPRIATFDNSATPMGEVDNRSIKTAAVDVDKLRAIIGDVVIEAEANDPKKLKEEIARLKAQATSRPAADPSDAALAAAKAAGYNDGYADGRDHEREANGKEGVDRAYQQAMSEVQGRLRGALDRVFIDMRAERLNAGAVAPPAPPAASAPPLGKLPARSPPHPKGEFVLGARINVLNALAWWKKAGFDPIDRRRACIMAGYSPKASTFGVYISELTRYGLVEIPAPGELSLTAAGFETAQPPSGKSLADMARDLLSPAEAKVFDALLKTPDRYVERGELADALGLSRTASTLGVYLSKLSGFGFTETKPGSVRISPWLLTGARG